MEYFIIFLIFIIIGLIIGYIILSNKNKNIIENTKISINKEIDKLNQIKSNKEQQLIQLNNNLSIINNQIKEKQQFNNTLYKIREEELNKIIDEKRQAKEEELQRDVDEWAESAQEAAEFNFNEEMNKLNVQIDSATAVFQQLTDTINEYYCKREAINQEIMRSRKLKEQQAFYQINLTNNAKEDINFLLSIVQNFHNKETIYKLIWSEYIQKPFKAMVNRTLEGRDPKNVIYMIQNIETQEIYIGKTRGDVSKRWTEHIKSSLNIGTISHMLIHEKLFNNWDSFTFTILEEVADTDSLSDREKYYINFYQSNIYGYNMKIGG